jgi:hypothetical protein
MYGKTHYLIFFPPKCLWLLHICFPYIGEKEEEMRIQGFVDLDTPIVIFIAGLNKGKEPKGRLERERGRGIES